MVHEAFFGKPLECFAGSRLRGCRADEQQARSKSRQDDEKLSHGIPPRQLKPERVGSITDDCRCASHPPHDFFGWSASSEIGSWLTPAGKAMRQYCYLLSDDTAEGIAVCRN